MVGLGAAFLSCVIGERIARTLASNITNISREIIREEFLDDRVIRIRGKKWAVKGKKQEREFEISNRVTSSDYLNIKCLIKFFYCFYITIVCRYDYCHVLNNELSK